MNEDQLYALARKRINQKHRRWLLWGIHLFAFLMYVGAATAYTGVHQGMLEFVVRAWFGVLVLHTLAIVMTQDRDLEIEQEVVKLRSGMDSLYEKPKRFELSDDGELEIMEAPYETASKRSR
jgi:hypothetical protein